jgi:hypothetical protein
MREGKIGGNKVVEGLGAFSRRSVNNTGGSEESEGSEAIRYGSLCMIPINPSHLGKMREWALIVGDSILHCNGTSELVTR